MASVGVDRARLGQDQEVGQPTNNKVLEQKEATKEVREYVIPKYPFPFMRGKNGGVDVGKPSASGDGEIRDEELRDVTQVTLDLTNLNTVLSERKDKIARIRFAWNNLLKLSQPPQAQDGKWTFLGSEADKLEFD